MNNPSRGRVVRTYQSILRAAVQREFQGWRVEDLPPAPDAFVVAAIPPKGETQTISVSVAHDRGQFEVMAMRMAKTVARRVMS